MASTRFFDDDCRVQKQLEESVNIGNYAINVPGNGLEPFFMSDPHVRLQKWGANLSKNQVDLENDLRGQTRQLNRDTLDSNYTLFLNRNPLYKKNLYPAYSSELCGQTRATNPAYVFRETNYLTDNVPNNFKYLFKDPQENVARHFENNLSSRILEKDYYTLNQLDSIR